MKRIILCADDYGQTNAISQAIIQLLEQKRINATSCLVNAPDWVIHANWLKNSAIQAQVGLHFNLTEGVPLSAEMRKVQGDSFPRLAGLFGLIALRRIKSSIVLAEIHAQIDAFVEGYGQLPAYLDGHQHVHHLPIIREAVIQAYQTRLCQQPGFYIRSTYDAGIWRRPGDKAFFKQIIIALTGGKAFNYQLKAKNIPHNQSFAGIYDFKESKQYHEKFVNFLSRIEDNGLIMCHPGLDQSPAGDDPIFYSRRDEFDYLSSPEFLAACQLHQVQLKEIQ